MTPPVVTTGTNPGLEYLAKIANSDWLPIDTSTAATGTVTSTTNANPADAGTIVIGSVTYRFKNTLAQANDVKIGADGQATLNNLKAALNGSTGSGSTYGTGTVANPNVTAPNAAAVSTDATLGVQARIGGTVGNGIAFTESATNITVSGSGTLSGGTGKDLQPALNPGAEVLYTVAVNATTDFADLLST